MGFTQSTKTPTRKYVNVETPDARPLRGAVGAVFATLRIALGAIFLWAFVDKLFGLGYSTAAGRDWLSGGSPTRGYLGSSVGPLAEPFKAMAGNAFVDALFMFALLGIGVALLVGMGRKVAGWSGAVLMMGMYASHFPPTTNPILDDHVIYAILFVGFAFLPVGHVAGLGRWWSSTPLVRRYRFLE